MGINYPITVNKIEFRNTPVYEKGSGLFGFGPQCGTYVAVRPVADEYEKKTFLGILIGAIAISMSVSWDDAAGVLHVGKYGHNPLIFIPEKNVCVFGYESWWGEIKSEADLRQITDADIENVWYVKALKALSENNSAQPGAAVPHESQS